MYEISYGAINRNLAEVSHEESLVRPPAGNCLNWVLGHIVIHRGTMLKIIGRRPLLEGERATPYLRGSPAGWYRALSRSGDPAWHVGRRAPGIYSRAVGLVSKKNSPRMSRTNLTGRRWPAPLPTPSRALVFMRATMPARSACCEGLPESKAQSNSCNQSGRLAGLRRVNRTNV